MVGSTKGVNADRVAPTSGCVLFMAVLVLNAILTTGCGIVARNSTIPLPGGDGFTVPPPGSIIVNTGENIQTAVDMNPPGSTFYLKAGIHRNQTISPKDGDTFIGEPGAILNGSKPLTSFMREGAYWVVSGQTQNGGIDIGTCDIGYSLCNHDEDLYFDDVPLQPVASLAEVTQGTWYFDHAAAKIYIASDPAGHRVETSVATNAFSGPATNVAIKGLIIERYAVPAQKGAVQQQGPPAAGWVIEQNEIRFNHAGGISPGQGTKILKNNIHHNGQMGIVGGGPDVGIFASGIVIDGNEIAFNNYAGYAWGWEAGGMKLSVTKGAVIRGNFVHDNVGPGLWTDIENIDTLYENNRTRNNLHAGIFHEISFKATIRYNVVENELGDSGSGILIANSSDVEVYGNTVTNSGNGIMGLEDDRGSSATFRLPYHTRNLYVHDNAITQTTGQAAGIVRGPNVKDDIFTTWNNRWMHNTYKLANLSGQYFEWLGAARTKEEWRRSGNDVDGIFQPQ